MNFMLYGKERQWSRRGRLLFTLEEKIACLKREIKLRQKVYPTRIANHRMVSKTAYREIELMKQILDDLEARLAAEEPQLDLKS